MMENSHSFTYFEVHCQKCGRIDIFSISLLGWNKAEEQAISSSRKHIQETGKNFLGKQMTGIRRLNKIHPSYARPI